MKNILFASTLLATAGLASAALADTPKVTVGGYINFEAGYASDDMDGTSTASQVGIHERPDAFRNDTQVDFKMDGKTDMFSYGGEVDLLADTSVDVQGRGFNASKTFIYLQCAKTGMRLEMGSNVGAESTLKVDAGSIARGTGGINGDWSYFANANEPFLAQTDLPLGYGDLQASDPNYLGKHTEENLIKITLYTPRFAGFQAGVSFLPDQQNRGQGSTSIATPAPYGPDRTDQNAGLSDNIWTGGINYDNKIGDVGVALAATGEAGQAQVNTYEDLRAWNVGGKLSYQSFSLAGSYGDWGKSNSFKAAHSKDTWYWDIGVAYEHGPIGASVTYLQSQYDCGTGAGGGLNNWCNGGPPQPYKNKFDNVVFSADYKLMPGFTPYAEISFFNENAGDFNNRDNKGTVTLLGSQLNF